ncbi:hypothetical protein AVEN_167906-1 [Araneus ventricosus]|uniref:Uncharacterized protein n=1 Tax=Araneus ventricosus TaxID=182803 RepID=A0A4Y2AUF6_ARAVE|nr:hypothetical protein AVEN_194157-1 [Araneus ventricosus]GBL83697.1 hypothetical protein AVEN_242386-1 [Araneus ventricosus]GBL83780.1 hypothetical protein AVEN_88679-1 [Araneus ventricosus]GBL83852.1 hypothetical protein AVEN_167906-1 [Araneus ventricosus]
MDQYQYLCRIAGKTWGINKNIRRLLYKTVIERTLCHEAAAWRRNMTPRLQEKQDTIQSLYLLYITGAYRTTAALQVATGLYNPSTYKHNKKQLMPELLEQGHHPTFSPLYSAEQITRAKAVEFIFTPIISFSTIKFHLQKITETQEPRLYILMDLKRTKALVAHIAFSKTME